MFTSDDITEDSVSASTNVESGKNDAYWNEKRLKDGLHLCGRLTIYFITGLFIYKCLTDSNTRDFVTTQLENNIIPIVLWAVYQLGLKLPKND